MKQSDTFNRKKTSQSMALGSVQSVQRAIDLLEIFPATGPEIGLSQIAELSNLNKATAYRLLSNLEDRGYLTRSPGTRKYRLGLKVFELGSYFQSQLEIHRMGLAFLRELVDQTRESAFLCIREGDDALCINRVENQQEVKIFSLRIGGKQPLHCGAAPRALLAGFNHQELSAYAERTGLPGFTPRSITNLKQLQEDVFHTRQQGYSVSIDDVVVGISAVGAPVYDHTGSVTASISLSGLSNHYTLENIPRLSCAISAVANQFSRQLGYQGKS